MNPEITDSVDAEDIRLGPINPIIDMTIITAKSRSMFLSFIMICSPLFGRG